MSEERRAELQGRAEELFDAAGVAERQGNYRAADALTAEAGALEQAAYEDFVREERSKR